MKTKLTGDNNTQVTLVVKHLAPPDRIAAGATTYVVWARPLGPSDNVYNLGGLKISKDLDGELDTVTPFHSFELFVTAEPSSSVTMPTGQRALWTTIAKE